MQEGLRILTAAGMKAAEDAAAQAGTSYEQLMENAGTAAARAIVSAAQRQNLPRQALLLCGRGNNAGDAFVVGRLLAQEGWQVKALLLLAGELSALARLNLGRMPPEVAVLHANGDAARLAGSMCAGVIVDGVFGTGFHGGLPPAAAAAFRRARECDGLKVALDVPSGMDCDSGLCAPGTFTAQLTLTFGAYKPGLLMQGSAAVCGSILCLDIGL